MAFTAHIFFVLYVMTSRVAARRSGLCWRLWPSSWEALAALGLANVFPVPPDLGVVCGLARQGKFGC